MSTSYTGTASFDEINQCANLGNAGAAVINLSPPGAWESSYIFKGTNSHSYTFGDYYTATSSNGSNNQFTINVGVNQANLQINANSTATCNITLGPTNTASIRYRPGYLRYAINGSNIFYSTFSNVPIIEFGDFRWLSGSNGTIIDDIDFQPVFATTDPADFSMNPVLMSNVIVNGSIAMSNFNVNSLTVSNLNCTAFSNIIVQESNYVATAIGGLSNNYTALSNQVVPLTLSTYQNIVTFSNYAQSYYANLSNNNVFSSNITMNQNLQVNGTLTNTALTSSSNASAFASNIGVFSSNTAVWSSNTSIAASNAGYYGSNTLGATSNVTYTISNSLQFYATGSQLASYSNSETSARLALSNSIQNSTSNIDIYPRNITLNNSLSNLGNAYFASNLIGSIANFSSNVTVSNNITFGSNYGVLYSRQIIGSIITAGQVLSSSSAGGSNSYAQTLLIKPGDVNGNYWGGSPSNFGADLVLNAGNVSQAFANNGSQFVSGIGGNLRFIPGYAYVSPNAGPTGRSVESGRIYFYSTNTNGNSLDSNVNICGTFDNYGKFGVGTSNPSAPVDVVATGDLTLGLSNSGSTYIRCLGSNASAGIFGVAGASNAHFIGTLPGDIIVKSSGTTPGNNPGRVVFGSGNSSSMVITNNGQVGIGVGSAVPSAKCHIVSSNFFGGTNDFTDVSSNTLTLTDTGMYPRIVMKSTDPTVGAIWNSESNKTVYFGETSACNLYQFRGKLTTTNIIGVNQTNPQFTLDVNGTANISGVISGPTILGLSNISVFSSNTSVFASNTSVFASNAATSSNIVIFPQAIQFSSAAGTGGLTGSGDFTNVTNPTILFNPGSTYTRQVIKSQDASISGVVNWQAGKTLFYGETGQNNTLSLRCQTQANEQFSFNSNAVFKNLITANSNVYVASNITFNNATHEKKIVLWDDNPGTSNAYYGIGLRGSITAIQVSDVGGQFQFGSGKDAGSNFQSFGSINSGGFFVPKALLVPWQSAASLVSPNFNGSGLSFRIDPSGSHVEFAGYVRYNSANVANGTFLTFGTTGALSNTMPTTNRYLFTRSQSDWVTRLLIAGNGGNIINYQSVPGAGTASNINLDYIVMDNLRYPL